MHRSMDEPPPGYGAYPGAHPLGMPHATPPEPVTTTTTTANDVAAVVAVDATVDEVGALLITLGLSEYLASLKEMGCETCADIAMFSEDELVADAKMKKLHVRKLLQHISSQKETQSPDASSAAFAPVANSADQTSQGKDASEPLDLCL